MTQNPFNVAERYLRERTGTTPERVPAGGNIQAMSYKYDTQEDALSALTVLTEMLSEYSMDYVQLSIMLTPYKNIVTLEIGDEEWDYDEEEDDWDDDDED